VGEGVESSILTEVETISEKNNYISEEKEKASFQ